MTEFQYTALDSNGREVTGALQAENRSAALARLKGMGMYPMGLETGRNGNGAGTATLPAGGTATAAATGGASPSFSFRRVSPSDLAVVTRQLASLFNAGLNIGRCIDTLADLSENPKLSEVLQDVRQAVHGGSALWEALERHPRVFNELYVSLVQAGEASGQLGKVLERLADQMEAQQEYNARIRSALSYPILLIGAGISAVVFILLFLVPRFAKIFNSMKKELPAPTKVLLNTQAFLSQYWWAVLLGIAAVYLLMRWWNRTDEGGLAIDRFKMRLMVLGPVIHKEAVSRFCRTMSTLVEGGVPILSSFEVSERAVGNRVLRRAIEQVKAAVREGESIAEPLRRSGVFPPLVTNMISVGEETGNLPEMLARVADAYDAEVSNRMRQLIALVEPGVIIIMGGIIGSIVLSMLLPVLELSTGF